jgi:hypothetical protein
VKTLVSALLAIPLLIACGGTGGTPAGGEAPAAAASSAPKVPAKVGVPMKASDGRTVTVLSFKRKYSTGNQFEVPAAGKEYVLVTYALNNGSSSEWSSPLFELNLIDSNGQKYSAGFVTGQGSVDSLVAHGKAPSVKQIYEVPKSAPLDVAWQPDIFDSTVLQTPLK